MTIEDIKNFIIRYNLDGKCREPYYVSNRMYLYAILYHKHDWSLSRIAKLFNRDHATVRHALIEAEHVQYQDIFINDTQMLTKQYYFIIPAYKGTDGKQAKRQTPKTYMVKEEVTKEQYIEYLKSKDPEIIYDIMWKLTIKKLKL